MVYETELTTVQFVLVYDNEKHPFAESPTRTRFFETSQELDIFIKRMSPDERILKGFRQRTNITREYFIGQE